MPGPVIAPDAKIPEPQPNWTLNDYFTNVGASGNPYLQLSLNNSYHTYFNNSGISNSFLSSPLRTAVFENNHKLAQIVSRGIIGFYQGMDQKNWQLPVTLSQFLLQGQYDEMDTLILQISGMIQDQDPVSAPEDPATDWYSEAFDSLPQVYKDEVDIPKQSDAAGATAPQLPDPNQAAAVPMDNESDQGQGLSPLPFTFAPVTTNFSGINLSAAEQQAPSSPPILSRASSTPGLGAPAYPPTLRPTRSEATTTTTQGLKRSRDNYEEVDAELAKQLQKEEEDAYNDRAKRARRQQQQARQAQVQQQRLDWRRQYEDFMNAPDVPEVLGNLFAQPAVTAFGGRKKKMTKKRNKKKKMTKRKGKGKKNSKSKKKKTKKHNKKKKKTRARGKAKGKKISKAKKSAKKKSGGARVGEDLAVPFSKLNV